MSQPQSEEERELLRLLAAPREHLNIEIKGWLNLKDELGRADLAKAILALANHGGGRILIGWTETKGGWQPDEPRPGNLSMYSQDCINGIVASYAEPVFHCEVEHLPRLTEQAYPLVLVPGRHRVPIRSKRDGPEGKHVRINTYYIRRPGPASESPQTAREWDELIRRCVLSAREELLDDFRRVLHGQPGASEFSATGPLPPTTTGVQSTEDSGLAVAYGPLGQAVGQWHAASTQRWRSLVKEHLANESPSRYHHGTWSVAYGLADGTYKPSLPELRDILVRAERHETGWPMWWVPTKEEIKPRPFEGLIECWIKDAIYQDGAHSDFWRASPTGMFFSVRGYIEDALEQHSPGLKVQPGTALDITIPIWRVAEVLLHATNVAKDFSNTRVTVGFRFHWDGLKNRKLASLSLERRSVHPHTSKQDAVDSMLVLGSDEIVPGLPEIVGKLTRPLYESFDFFVPPSELIEAEIANFRATASRSRIA